MARGDGWAWWPARVGGAARAARRARRRPIGGLARRAHDLPEAVATVLCPVMQLGTLGAPVLVAAAVGLRLRSPAGQR